MSRGRITIVDDDRETRSMLRMALELEGYQVIEAANGLRLISSLHVDRPDVILLERAISWVDGFELCRAVKKNPAFRDIPVVFVSGRRRTDDVVGGLEAGAVDFFPKPLDLPRLLLRIRELVPPQGEEAE